MDLTKDGEKGEREGTPKGKVGKEGTNGGTCGCDDMEQYDPDPHGCASSIDQLVAALCEAFVEGSPQHSRKRKQIAGPFSRRDTDDSVDSDLGDEDSSKPQVKIPSPIFKGLPGE